MRRNKRTSLALSVALALVALGASSCREPEEREERKEARGFALPAGDAQHGREAFVALKCNACHEVAGLENELPRPVAVPVTGVKLGGLSMREPTDGELVTSIVNASHRLYPAGEPERITVDGESRMANMNEVMTVQQLLDIIAFLHERYETTPAATGGGK